MKIFLNFGEDIELETEINKYKEKNEKFAPATKDIFNGLLGMAGDYFNKKGNSNLQNTPEIKENENKTSFEFEIKDKNTEQKTDKEKLKDLFENLSGNEQDEFLDNYIEPELEDIENTDNQTKETQI